MDSTPFESAKDLYDQALLNISFILMAPDRSVKLELAHQAHDTLLRALQLLQVLPPEMRLQGDWQFWYEEMQGELTRLQTLISDLS